MTNQKINIHNESNINAIGEHNSAHCKPVVCLEDGTPYSSITDAAKAAGVSYQTMWGHLNGRLNSVKKKHYDYLDNVLDNPDVMFKRLRQVSAVAAENAKIAADNAEDARKWREYQAQLAAVAAAEAKRLEDARKAKEKHDAAVAKAEAKVNRIKASCERMEAKLQQAREKLTAAQNSLDELNGNESDDVAA
jgi:chromosome segregation ATPase